MFDFWSCVQRKNPEVAIRPYLDAFQLSTYLNTLVHLIVKTQHGSHDQIKKHQEMTHTDPRVHFLSGIVSTGELKHCKIEQTVTSPYIEARGME